jgi:hypothetical protein
MLSRRAAPQRLVSIVFRFSRQTQQLFPMAAVTPDQNSLVHTLADKAPDHSLSRTKADAIDAATTAWPPAPFVSSEDVTINLKYRPFLLDESITKSDWISQLKLARVMEMAQRDHGNTGKQLRILVLYGSLRERYNANLPCPSLQANSRGVEGLIRNY